MRRGSLRLRLAVIGAVAVLVALTAAAFGLARLFEQHVERRAVAELSAHLDQLVAGLERDAQGRLTLVRRPADPRFQAPLSGLYWQIGPVGEPSLRSRSLWDSALPLPADPLDGGEHRHRLAGPGGAPLLALERRVTLPPRLGGEAIRVVVAVERREIEAAAENFLRDMLPYLGLLALALSLAGWAQLSLGLRPLRRVGERVAAVRSGRATRLGGAFPRELRPLAAQVDDLIAAREAEAERARRRAADLAHGLKTPLQALVGEASRLRARGEATAAEGIEEIATAMRRHVDRELVRARAAARAPGASCAPAEVIDRVLAVLSRTPEGRRLEWLRRASGALRAGIDGDDLTEALGAIMENAARHARDRVETEVFACGGRVVVRVRDDGPGIPETEAQRLLGRNERLDRAGPGNGLGLSIARDILEAAGGELKLRSRGGGLEADLALPLARGAPASEA